MSKKLVSKTPFPSLKPRFLLVPIYILALIILGLGLWFFWESYQSYQTKRQSDQAKEDHTVPSAYACSPDGRCLVYPEFAALELCPTIFESVNCDNQCDLIDVRCKN